MKVFASFQAVNMLTLFYLSGVESKPLLGRAGNSSAARRAPQDEGNNTDESFEWAAIGDSWSSGVAYSPSTIYDKTDLEFCYRTNQAWGALMEQDTSWVSAPAGQKFHFSACGGTLMNDIGRQLGKSGRPQMVLGTFGGNDAQFGDIARACIYKPRPGPWGKDYDEDPNGEGSCKKYLKASRDYIDDQNPAGHAKNFEMLINSIKEFSQKEGQQRSRFDLVVSSYVKFFNADTDACDGYTFARWFSTGKPKLVKALRREMNELVDKFNDVSKKVLDQTAEPLTVPSNGSEAFHQHYVPISEQFEGHRFCEETHSFDDQWYSADVWLWNLSWKDGNVADSVTDMDEDASMKLQKTENGVTFMDKPPSAEDKDYPVLSLDTNNRNAQDDQFVPLQGVDPASQSGFGWTARPFHPKPNGYTAMKDLYIQAIRAAKIPGVKE